MTTPKDRSSAMITITPVVIQKMGPDETWWILAIEHGGQRQRWTCFDKEEAELKRAHWLKGGDPDQMSLKVRAELLAEMANAAPE